MASRDGRKLAESSGKLKVKSTKKGLRSTSRPEYYKKSSRYEWLSGFVDDKASTMLVKGKKNGGCEGAKVNFTLPN